jgi:hypothetical protein
MLAGPGFTKTGGTNRDCTLGQQEWSCPLAAAAWSVVGVADEVEAAHAPGTLHSASVANIKAAMNRFFIPGSLCTLRVTDGPSWSL